MCLNGAELHFIQTGERTKVRTPALFLTPLPDNLGHAGLGQHGSLSPGSPGAECDHRLKQFVVHIREGSAALKMVLWFRSSHHRLLPLQSYFLFIFHSFKP